MKMFILAIALCAFATPALAQATTPLVVDRSVLVSTNQDEISDVCGLLAQRKLSLQNPSWADGLTPEEENGSLRGEIDDCTADAEAFAELLEEREVVEIREAS